MRILVSGATGLVGTELTRLLAPEHEITALARSHDERSDALTSFGANVIFGELRQAVTTTTEAHDAVIHLAQSERFRDFPGGATDVVDVNTASTAFLAQWAIERGATRFILASSGSVYPASPNRHREDEPIPITGHGLYAASKLASEVVLGAFASAIGVTAVRPFFVYGSQQRPSMLMKAIAASVREGSDIRFSGDADGLRLTPVHVRDAAIQIRAALLASTPPAVMNVAGAAVTLRQVVGTLSELIGRDPVIKYLPGPTQAVLADTTLVESIAGPLTTSLVDGLRELCSC